MSLVEEAFSRLYPNKEWRFNPTLKYSRKFSPYNANIKLYGDNLSLNLSAEWKGVDREIVIGLLQSLMVKLFSRKTRGKRPHTTNIDYYNNFIKKLHLVAPKTSSEPPLVELFEQLNAHFFTGLLEQPNLKWGSRSTTKLGHYDYHTDTIVISTILKDSPEEYLAYVLYHEMLHKKLKYTCSNGRSRFHTPEFKREEAKFPESTRIEKDLNRYASYHKLKKKAPQRSSFLSWLLPRLR